MLVERPASVDEGFSLQAPLVYHYGHKNLNQNSTLFTVLVSRMAEVVQDRMAANKKGKDKSLTTLKMYYLYNDY